MHPDRPVQTTLAFHASRIVIDVGVLLAMASMSLTFIDAPGGGRSALAADALPALLLILPIFVVTLIPDHTRPLHPILGWISMVLALAALPYAFVKLLDAGILADTLGGSVGLGPIVLLFGCVVTLIGIGIGILRDLAGKPSGGTPQRNATYETRRSRARAATDPASAESGRPPAATIPVTVDQPTRTVESTAPSTPDPVAPEPAEPAASDHDSDPAPLMDQPPIVFPDTGAVAREAEPDDDPTDDLLNTAERADIALTESLLPMLEPQAEDDAGDEADGDRG